MEDADYQTVFGKLWERHLEEFERYSLDPNLLPEYRRAWIDFVKKRTAIVSALGGNPTSYDYRSEFNVTWIDKFHDMINKRWIKKEALCKYYYYRSEKPVVTEEILKKVTLALPQIERCSLSGESEGLLTDSYRTSDRLCSTTQSTGKRIVALTLNRHTKANKSLKQIPSLNSDSSDSSHSDISFSRSKARSRSPPALMKKLSKEMKSESTHSDVSFSWSKSRSRSPASKKQLSKKWKSESTHSDVSFSWSKSRSRSPASKKRSSKKVKRLHSLSCKVKCSESIKICKKYKKLKNKSKHSRRRSMIYTVSSTNADNLDDGKRRKLFHHSSDKKKHCSESNLSSGSSGSRNCTKTRSVALRQRKQSQTGFLSSESKCSSFDENFDKSSRKSRSHRHSKRSQYKSSLRCKKSNSSSLIQSDSCSISSSKSPVRSVRSRSPVRSVRSKSPVISIRSKSPVRSKRAKSPVRSNRYRSLVLSDRSKTRSPVSSNRSSSSVSEKVNRSKDRSPVIFNRSRSRSNVRINKLRSPVRPCSEKSPRHSKKFRSRESSESKFHQRKTKSLCGNQKSVNEGEKNSDALNMLPKNSTGINKVVIPDNVKKHKSLSHSVITDTTKSIDVSIQEKLLKEQVDRFLQSLTYIKNPNPVNTNAFSRSELRNTVQNADTTGRTSVTEASSNGQFHDTVTLPKSSALEECLKMVQSKSDSFANRKNSNFDFNFKLEFALQATRNETSPNKLSEQDLDNSLIILSNKNLVDTEACDTKKESSHNPDESLAYAESSAVQLKMYDPAMGLSTEELSPNLNEPSSFICDNMFMNEFEGIISNLETCGKLLGIYSTLPSFLLLDLKLNYGKPLKDLTLDQTVSLSLIADRLRVHIFSQLENSSEKMHQQRIIKQIEEFISKYSADCSVDSYPNYCLGYDVNKLAVILRNKMADESKLFIKCVLMHDCRDANFEVIDCLYEAVTKATKRIPA